MVVDALAIFFSFIIGAIFGGMATFLYRGAMLRRQMRIAERRAARVVTEARNESKELLNEARGEADKVKSLAETSF